MSFTNLETSLNNFLDLKEAPNLRKEIQDLKNELKRREDDYKARQAVKDSKIAKLKQELSVSNNRCKNLERISKQYDGNTFSLEEFDKLVRDRFNKKVLKMVYEKALAKFESDLPGLIKTEISKYPNNCNEHTRYAIDQAAVERRDTLLRQPDTWPKWFQATIDQEAQKIANSYYNAEFWRQVDRKKDKIVDQITKEYWPTYLDRFYTPYLQQEINQQLHDLNLQLTITCGSCGNEYDVTLDSENISQLIRKGFTIFTCPFSRVLFKHRYRLSLADTILALTSGNSQMPERRRKVRRVQVYRKRDKTSDNVKEDE